MEYQVPGTEQASSTYHAACKAEYSINHSINRTHSFDNIRENMSTRFNLFGVVVFNLKPQGGCGKYKMENPAGVISSYNGYPCLREVVQIENSSLN